MKNKLTDFEKEKNKLKFTKTIEFVLLLLMTCLAFVGFMLVLVSLCFIIKEL
jgi:hypothetical protein